MTPEQQHRAELDRIPRADLVSMLSDCAWWTAGRKEFERHGFSLDVKEETALRDVNYRNAPLFETTVEAIVEHWKRHYPIRRHD